MILDIKSLAFLHIPLFYLVDRTWNKMHYRGEFTFLFMLQLAQEAEIMMNNLIPYLKHQNGEKVLRYVIEEAKQEAEKDGWNKENKRVICATDEFLEKELEDNIGLIDTQSYLEVRKKEMEEAQL